MRYKPGHKERARELILETASGLLRKNHYAGIGVDALMAAAGLTSGAFYSNFASKQQLLEEVLDRDLSRIRDSLLARAAEARPGWLAEFVRHYIHALSKPDAAIECRLTALSPDIAGAGPEVGRLYEQRLGEIVEALALGVTPGPSATERAWQLLATMIGAVAVARALPEGAATDQLLQATAHLTAESREK